MNASSFATAGFAMLARVFANRLRMVGLLLSLISIAQSTGWASPPVINGWTNFTLRPGGKIYYASTAGNDANDGLSTATPVKNPATAISRMQGGDWLLLRRGDEFSGGLVQWKNGASEEYPTLYGAYGDEALPRPIINPNGSYGFTIQGGGGRPATFENVAIVGLHFWQKQRNPAEPGYVGDANVGTSSVGIWILRPARNILIEDVMTQNFGLGLSIQAEGTGIFNVTIRRCVSVDNYNRHQSGHAQGLYASSVNGLLIEECVFDHNGHSPWGLPGTAPTIFNHNLYIQNSNQNVVVRDNILARAASHGMQLRPGGLAEHNVFIQNGISAFAANDHVNTGQWGIRLNENVAIEGAGWVLYSGDSPQGTRGWGFELVAAGGRPIPSVIEMKNNVVANASFDQAQGAFIVPPAYAGLADTSGNITYNWGTSEDTPGVFPDPGRTSATYNATLNGTATTDAYLQVARQQRKGNWNPAYEARALWNYIRAGFGLATPPIVPVTGVSVEPASAALAVGETQSLTATLAPANASERRVSWSSSNPAVATVDRAGIVTAVAAGSATITVTTYDGGFVATSSLTISVQPVTGVSVSPAAVTLNVSQTQQLVATISPANATDQTVTWTSSDTAVATVSGTGLVTAVGGGNATITVTTRDGGFTASAAFTIDDPFVPVAGVTLAPLNVALTVGQTRSLVATVLPAHATNKTVAWSSSNAAVATVDSAGLVTAVAPGSATVTATTDDGGFAATASIGVLPLAGTGEGWTSFTLRPGGSVYYVSTSGSDANDGLSPGTPLRNPSTAISRMQGGDWLLFKRGDEFSGGLTQWKNGPSPEHPTVYGAYGDDALPRPVINPLGSYGFLGQGGGGRPATLENVAIVSLHFWQKQRDPADPSYVGNANVGSQATGIWVLRPARNILIEDVMTQNFAIDMSLQAEAPGIFNVTIRRCVAVGNYNVYQSGHAQGLYASGIDGLLIEESLFDHNGHSAWAIPGAEPTIFNHNLYIQNSNRNVVVRRNVLARAASHGMQLRPGGLAEQNVFVQNGIAGFAANDHDGVNQWGLRLNENVATEGAGWVLYSGGTPQGTRGWGFELVAASGRPIPTVLEMKNNVVANASFASAQGSFIVPSAYQGIADVSGNITYNWGSSANTPGTFTDPNRTSASYNATLGGPANTEAYLLAARLQRKGNWNPAYTAIPLWNYIRAGFDLLPPVVTGVSVAPTEATLAIGETRQLTATVTPANALDKSVTWTSSDPAVASVSGTGLVTALAGGSATITVTTIDGGFAASSLIVVHVPVTGVSIEPTSAALIMGQSRQLTATVSPANATNPNVTWSTGDPAVVVVDDSGSVTAVGVGEATVTVTTVEGGFTAETAVSVAPAPATIALANLHHTFDGSPKPATATTVPAGLPVVLTYDGNTTPPTNAGSYAVEAAIADPNYTGSASGTLTIGQAGATVILSSLRQSYDGTPKGATVATLPADLAVSVTYDGSSALPTLPGSYAVVATIDEANYTGNAEGTLVITTTVLVRHAPTLNGDLDGSVQLLLAESTTLNGGASISGDLLVPGTPSVQLNGNPLYGGTRDSTGSATPTDHRITLNGNAVLRYTVRRVDAIAMPTVAAPPAPAGTINVTINHSGQHVGDWSTVRNLTLNGSAGLRAVPPGTYGSFTANGNSGFILGVAGATEPAVYNLQNLTLNGGSQLQVVGPVILTLANGVNVNGSMGAAAHPDWLIMRIASGGLALNGSVTVSGTVIAPSGAVMLNGSSTVTGEVVCDRLTLNGGALVEQP